MGFIFKFSYANLLRKLNRTMVVMILIAIGVAGMMFMQGFYDGLLNTMKENVIRSGTGHIIIENAEYKESELFKDRIENAGALAGEIEKLGGVKIVVPKLLNEGVIATASASRFIRILGIDPDKEIAFGRLDEYIIDGEYGFGARNRGVMIGKRLADRMNLKVGKKLVLTAQAASGEIVSYGARVQGILLTNNPAVDEYTVMIDIGAATRLFAAEDSLTSIAIMLEDESLMGALKKQIGQLLPERIATYTWSEYYPFIGQYQVTISQFGGYSYIIVFLIVSIGIFNVILISVLERVRVYGIMMAVGTSFGLIRNQIILESLLIGFGGLIMGAVIGSALLFYYGTFGMDFGGGDILKEYGISNYLYPVFSFDYVVTALVAVSAATLLSSLVPIRILKKRNPMGAIHFV